MTDWLKLEFIESFFTLLAEEGTGDKRRLMFWKRYVHAIDHIHFALGTEASESRTKDFVVLRQKMEGLSIPLQDTVRSNNAFIMQLGKVAVVEFGGFSNACYFYQNGRPFDVTKPVVSRVDARNSLKHSEHVLKLLHKDGIHGWDKWEQMFEATLQREFGIAPTLLRGAERRVAGQPPTTPTTPAAASSQSLTDTHYLAVAKRTGYTRTALSSLAGQFKLEIVDLSARNGNLWLRAGDSDAELREVLLKWGFRYKAGKGWWK